MSFQPNLSNIILELCCQKSIETINRIIWSGKWLQRILIPVAFTSLFISPKDAAGRGRSITTINAIHQTDWKMLVEATITIPEIAKSQCATVCFQESLKHNGKLKQFWEGLYDVFR